MARDPFASMNPEMQRKRGLARISAGSVLGALGVLGSIALLFGYYVPLSSAHSTLAKEHEVLNTSHAGTNTQLTTTTQQLLDAQKQRDELASKLETIEEKARAQAKRREGLVAGLKDKLSQALGDEASVEEGGEVVEVAIDNLKLFRPHEVEVLPQGRKLLCQLGKPAKDSSARVEVHGFTSGNKVLNPVLRKGHATVWEASAARAVSVLRVLESCGVAAKQLSAVGRAHHGVGKLLPKSDGQIRIRLGSALE